MKVALRLRALRDRGLAEVPSTRLLVHAARLVRAGVDPRRAAEVAIAAALSDDAELVGTLHEIIGAVLG